MKKKLNLLFSFMVMLCLMVCLGLNASAAEVVETGSCGAEGDNVTWTLYSNGDLVISGTGEMYDGNVNVAYENEKKVVNVIIEYGVTSIGDRAFDDFDEIVSVTIPDSVTTIGEHAFDACGNLTNVTIPGSVTTIGSHAFNCCFSFTEIIIPEGVTTIDEYAFASCLGVETLTIADTVTSIGDYAFAELVLITNATIPGSVTNIGQGVFAYCESLESITLPEDFTSIPFGMLGACGFTDIIIPDSVTSIGDFAFTECVLLTNVIIPDSVTSIGESAFAYCESLESITIGSGVTSVGDYIFEECASLTDIYFNGTEEKWNSLAVDTNTGYNEVTVHFMVCDNHSDADNDTYCDNCGEIFVVDSGACGDNVTWVLDSKGDLVISGTGEIVDAHFEKRSDDIKNVIIEDGVTSIGRNAFSNCEKLVSVTIPDSVTSIGESAFSSCGSLASVTIPDGVVSIGRSAFLTCFSLKSVIIPDSVITVDDCAFGNCQGLESVIIGNGVETIGDSAFDWCFLLTDITIPASVKHIGEGVFAWCVSLEKITVDENNEYYSSDSYGALFNKDKTELITYPAANTSTTYEIPNGVTSVCTGAFAYAINLTEVVIPDSVETIGMTVFALCENLTTVTIGSGVTSIDEEMFMECESLSDVYYNGTEEDWKKISINGDNEALLNALKFLVVPHTHTAGEWEIVVEATYEAAGKKVQKCTGCGEIVAEEVIPQLERVVVEDTETGVAIEFDSDKYDGEVEVSVEETFDGKAFEIISASVGSTKATVFDISMTLDDTAIQPNGKITVKIPLPEGYDADLCVIYYLNTDNGTIEEFETKYVDGYLVFETDHFSYYAVVEVPVVEDDTDNNNDNVTDNCSCMCHKDGFMGFIWKIVSFFWKLFKMNPVCACGANHY